MIPAEPVYNPPIPFVDHIGVVRPGTTFLIQGFIPNSSQGFQVNLACGNCTQEGPNRSDIAFHFNPRMPPSSYVARNSLQNQSWGAEEAAVPSGVFPFEVGKNFEIMILAEATEYKVAVNGLHYLTFNHRIPLDYVNTLQIVGQVMVQMAVMRTPQMPGGPQVCPMGPPGMQPQVCPMPAALYDPAVPFEYPVPGGMAPGKTLFVSGRPTPYAERFQINFLCAMSYRGPETIALHFNPRFYDGENTVVRNALIDGGWGAEERQISFFPFNRNTTFDISFRCEPDKFLIIVNGQHLCNYAHRLPFNYIDRIAVEGDVAIASISFQ